MRVLSIGQLPKEIGGNYTTGIAKVVFELSKQSFNDVKMYLYATNISDKLANKHSSYPHQYMGYRTLIGRMLINILSNPIQTIRQWRIYKTENKVNPLRFEFYKANMQRAISLVKPDIIHLHGNGLAPLYFARTEKEVPIVLTCHGVFQRTPNPNSQQKRYTDYVTGLTNETKDEIMKYFFVDEKKITLIPNGVDTKKFYYSPEERKNVRKVHHVADSTIVFITVASVQERKGQYAFCKILENLNIDWQYWIIGKGADEQRIIDFAKSTDLEDRIKVLGYRNSDDLYKYYSAADVYAHASTMEGQALCEIEAYTTGIRTVVNKVITGTVANDVYADPMGYYVMDFSNPNLSQLKEWIAQGNQNRKTKPNFDWSIIAQKYEVLYHNILNKSNRK